MYYSFIALIIRVYSQLTQEEEYASMVRRKTIPRKRRPIKRARSYSRRRTSTKRAAPSDRTKATSTKRKKSGIASRVKKGTLGEHSFAMHHQVRMNPFNMSVSQPKIVDGETPKSLSRRLQTVIPHRTNADTCHIIFAPTLGVPLCFTNTIDGQTLRPLSSVQPTFVGFPGQTVGIEPQVLGVPKWPLGAGDVVDLKNVGGFSKWRIVSQGLRMNLDATAEENDGWYEVCRFNWRNENRDVTLTPLDGGVSTPLLGAAPNPINSDLYAMSMVEQPGYCTGSLKDIEKYEFKLNPQTGNHVFREITETNRATEAVDITRDTNAFKADIDESPLGNQLKDQYVDHSMDWLYIRIHGRSTASGGSKLILSAIQNLEFYFSPSSDLATFQTINKRAPDVEKVADKINNDLSGHHRRRK